MDVIGPIFWLIVALGLLVTFHEFGHFWVARRCGVRVLVFSIGFGQPLWSKTANDGTRYQIAAIPLGGYVKMQDERAAPVPTDQASESFNRKPVGQRIAIVAAGPVFNIVFALVAFWLMFLIGIAALRPVVGEPTGIAQQAGIQAKDEIQRINGKDVETWTHALLTLMPLAVDRATVELELETAGRSLRTARLDLTQLGDDFEEDQVLEAIGLSPWRPTLPATIGEVQVDSPASVAGLKPGDLITAINGRPVTSWQDIVQWIPLDAMDASGNLITLDVTVERRGQSLVFQIDPRRDESSGRPFIGIQAPEPSQALQEEINRVFVIQRYGPMEAMRKSLSESWRLSSATLGMLGRMILGRASLENLSGPITIAQMADQSARLGISRFLFFLGLISLSLAIINLLPIPILDGGHLLYYLIEIVKGSPVSEQTQALGQYLGLVLVVMLMGIAIFNDILRLFA
jgi:regulator of sigma E protease